MNILASTSKDPRGISKTIEFPSKEKASEILFLLDAQREDGTFCDVEIKLNPNKTVHAHKAVLASCSFYFKSMFTSHFMEASSDVIDLSHAAENSEVLEQVINSFYGHTFTVSISNVGETLNLASMFLLDDLKSVCGTVLFDMVNVGNAAEIFLMSVNYDMKILQRAVMPIYSSRFHDSIMFQDEVLEFTPIQLRACLTNANIENVSRKGEFLNMLLRWFSANEKDERAECLAALLDELHFKVTRSIYKENEESINEISAHLFDANGDISLGIAEKLKAALDSLKPEGYDPSADINGVDEEFEETPKPIHTFNYQPPIQGCRMKKEGYTSEEEKEYKRNQKQVAFNEHHRELARIWPPSLKCTEPPPYHPDRPDEIIRELPWPVLESRRFPVKSAEELLEEAKLLDMVVVLAPGLDYFEQQNKTNDDWSMEICAYIPGMKAWYKLGSIDANSPQKFGRRCRKTTRDMYKTAFLASMGGRHSRDHRMLEWGLHRRMYDFFDEDMDMGDMDPMMLREMMMMGGGPRGHRHHHILAPEMSQLPPLSNKKWAVTYLKNKLFFCHPDFCENVLIYDLLNDSWNQTGFDAVDGWNATPITVEGIELTVLGQVLYAVVRIVIYENRRRDHYYDEKEEPKMQYARVNHKIYRYHDDRGSWSHHFTTTERFAKIPIEQSTVPKPRSREDRGRHSFHDFDDIPMIRQPGTFRTVLFSEDEQKINILLLVKMYDEKPQCYSFSNLIMVYLDLQKDNDDVKPSPHQRFLSQPTTLFDDDLVIFINDKMEPTCRFDARNPNRLNRFHTGGNTDAETDSKFAEAEESHPLRPIIQACDGRRLWVLEGDADCTSKTTEYTVSACNVNREVVMNTLLHPPPPFRGFAMACTGRLDKNRIKSIQPPTKYLHP